MIIQTQKSHETLIKQNKTKQNKNGTDHFSREVNYSVLCNRVALMDFFLMKIDRIYNCGECHVRAHQPLLLLQRYFVLLFLMEFFFLIR